MLVDRRGTKRVVFEYRPYGENSSFSSKGETNSEVFGVYFNGMMMIREERVGGSGSKQKRRKAVAMAGIGVAICDSRDKLIYGMKKPLDMVKDGLISKLCVEEKVIIEAKALIEALNASTTLNLKRILIVYKIDDTYETGCMKIVSGRCKPKRERIKRFVDEVNLLRKKFSHCKPALVAPCKGRFTSRNGAPKFPNEDCDSDLRIETCEMILTRKLIKMMRKHLKEASIPVTEKVYFPYPKCSTLMSKSELLRFPRYVHESGAKTCYKCHGNFCINCRAPWHINMTCREYKRRKPMPLVEESKLKTLAAENLWH
ncbi:E3 ubiquitin-protein ligase RSL1-like [Rutidosis leptorrhynchoides]|uniref:E3 ubiquitin-protein ligase RSL1-like n=1 Tax=Rutidosis leptorrhynchoides TaxID=125765 RepID=UPI003A98E753